MNARLRTPPPVMETPPQPGGILRENCRTAGAARRAIQPGIAAPTRVPSDYPPPSGVPIILVMSICVETRRDGPIRGSPLRGSAVPTRPQLRVPGDGHATRHELHGHDHEG